MALTITETAISAAAKRAVEAQSRVELIDSTQPGLRLRISPGGAKTWAVALRDPHARMRRFALGNHPAMGVSAARDAARALWAKVRIGLDPVEEARHKRAAAEAARAGIGTLNALLELYEVKRGATLKSWPECRRRVESVFHRRLKTSLAVLRLGDLQMDADGWPSAQSAAAAIRYLRPVLKWAAQPGRAYVARELAELSPPAAVGRRERILSRSELSRLLPALRASARPYAAAARFLLLTLARREEACGGRWRDVDLEAGTWTIPATKNGKPHVVPLSRQAIELLAERLPRDAHGQAGHADPNTFLFATEAGGALQNWDRETKALMTASGTSGWTRHDLRRTGATLLGEMGETPDIIEASLNHTSIRSALAATYNKSRYRPQVAAALQRLADALDGIEIGGATVVKLRA